MLKELEITKIKDKTIDSWLDDADAALPAEFAAEDQNHVNLTQRLGKRKIQLRAHDLTEKRDAKFKVELDDTVGEAFAKAADALGKPLLPPSPQKPLDVLRFRKRGEWSEPVTNLEQPFILWLLRGGSRNLGIEYKLVVKINAQWGIAPSANVTPRELLAAFGMDAGKFTLYKPEGVDPLPPDTPLNLMRGAKFEAQADGRYGSGLPATNQMRVVRRGSQTIEDDVAAIREAGVDARLHSFGGQKYVELRELQIPSPPWGKTEANILIAVPATYPAGGLDALYVELPMSHTSNSIPYQQNTIHLDARNWILISWHYHESRPWNPLIDDLSTHLEHCRGFFLTRGVKQ